MISALEDQDISPRRRRRRRIRTSSTAARTTTHGSDSTSSVWQRLKTLLLGVIAVALVTTGVIVTPRIQALNEPLSRNVIGTDVQHAALDLQIVGAVDSGVRFERSEEYEYVVEEGETLSEIARRFEVEDRVLAEHNNLADPHRISVGQRLVIPPAELRSP